MSMSIRIRTTTHRNLRRITAETGGTILDLLDRLAAEEWARVGAETIAQARADLERAAVAAQRTP